MIKYQNYGFTIKLNWGFILAFSAFWCYSICALGISSSNFGLNLFFTLIVYLVFLISLIFTRIKLYNDIITIDTKDIKVFISYFMVMFILSYESLFTSIEGDQLYHSIKAQEHFMNFVHMISKNSNILDNYSFSLVLHLISLSFIILMLVIFRFIKNINLNYKILIFSCAFLSFRFLYLFNGGNTDPHPPLRLFPLWISSSIFSISDFSFRFPQFLGLIVMMTMVFKMVNIKLNSLNSWLFGLAAGTIPVLWHSSVIVEQSIWTAIIWSLLLIFIINENEFEDIKFIRWFSLLSIFSLMRASAFVGFIPLLILLFLKKRNEVDFNIKNLMILLSPLIIFLPYFIKTIMYGTPASYDPSEIYSLIPVNKGSFIINRIIISIKSGIGPKIIFYNIMIPWILFFPIAFIPFQKKNISKIVLTIIFFLSAYSLFYMVRPIIWGVGRYQAEYVVPFIILGLFYFTSSKFIMYKYFNYSITLLLCFLLTLNLNVIINFYNLNSTTDKIGLGKNIILSENLLYNYKDAYQNIIKSNYAGKTFSASLTYDIMPEIIRGYTVDQVKKTKEINKILKRSNLILTNENIDDLNLVQLVLYQGNRFDQLENLGWVKWKKFKSYKYTSTLSTMVRDLNN